MSSRTLRALRFSIKLPGRPCPWQTVVGVGRKPQVDTLTPGTAYCDLGVGSLVETHSHGQREIVKVEIEDADPASEKGRSVTSGRAWLRGE